MPKEFGNLRLYDLKEISEQLDLSVQTLRTYIQEGRLKGRKWGKAWYVSEAALQEYFTSPPKEELREDDENKPTSDNTENRK